MNVKLTVLSKFCVHSYECPGMFIWMFMCQDHTTGGNECSYEHSWTFMWMPYEWYNEHSYESYNECSQKPSFWMFINLSFELLVMGSL